MTNFSLLVDQCMEGNQSAVSEFVRRFRNQVYLLCYRMVGEHHEAEDMAQETFLRVFRNLHRWDRNRPIEPWIMTIAGNRCRTHLAQRNRRPIACESQDHVEDHRGTDHRGELLAEEVQLALSHVREEYRMAFLLFHDHQMSYGEIAEQMECPLGTVKTWVHRARRELVQRLANRGVTQDYRAHQLAKSAE
ncbi:RNA polymerase sigma factor [Bremerella sp. T1]|uniref:RNA polymerase sigma factor n=1 Tax=Bremerella sp. TYQ1 TaxID=3119568 RepID=UPI001CCE34C5|nr:sigma-70 family RNA polymerase sigma factor [Bremerella volcania]UBM38600.1 sigma-70 family RNA polymerase sigma factor [Bremerella volcania]